MIRRRNRLGRFSQRGRKWTNDARPGETFKSRKAAKREPKPKREPERPEKFQELLDALEEEGISPAEKRERTLWKVSFQAKGKKYEIIWDDERQRWKSD